MPGAPQRWPLTCHRSYWRRRLGTCSPPACATFPTSSWRRTGWAGWEKTWWWVAAVPPPSSSRAGRAVSASVVCVQHREQERVFLAWCLLFFSRIFYWWPIHFLLTYYLGEMMANASPSWVLWDSWSNRENTVCVVSSEVTGEKRVLLLLWAWVWCFLRLSTVSAEWFEHQTIEQFPGHMWNKKRCLKAGEVPALGAVRVCDMHPL